MYLGIIAGSSLGMLEKVIKSNFDNIIVTNYANLSNFVHETSIRSTPLDRLIILQDALGDDISEDALISFSDYLYSNFPVARVITLGKSQELTDKLSRTLFSSKMLHLCRDKLSQRMVCDLASLSIEELTAHYGVKEVPVVQDTVVIPVAPVVTPKPVAPAKPLDTKKPPKKGWFSFGKKKQDDTQETSDTVVVQDDINTEVTKEVDYDIKEDEGVFDIPSMPTEADSLVTPLPDFDSDFQFDDDSDDNNESDFNFDDDEEHEAVSDIIETNEDSEDSLQSDISDFDNFNFDTDFGDEEEPDMQAPESTDVVDEDSNDFEEDLDDFEDTTETTEDVVEFAKEDNFKSADEIEFDTDLDFSDTDFNAPEEQVVFPHKPTPSGSFDVIGDSAPKHVEEKIDTDISDKLARIIELGKGPSVDLVGTPDIKPNSYKLPNKDMDELSGDTEMLDLTSVQKAYDESKKPKEKIVEKLVEVEKVVEVERIVEKVVEKVVTINTGEKAYKHGIRIIIVTGDRRSGVTRNALNMASLLANKGETLFVDFDIDRHGSLSLIGIDDLVDADDHVQHALSTFTNVAMLDHLVYTYMQGGFDCLLSFYDSEVTEQNIETVQSILTSQTTYKNIVVDCPLQYLNKLYEMVMYAEVVFCCEQNQSGVINLLYGLDKLSTDMRFKTLLYNHSNFLVTRGTSVSEFSAILNHMVEIFSIEKSNHNWALTPILGTDKQIVEVVERL